MRRSSSILVSLATLAWFAGLTLFGHALHRHPHVGHSHVGHAHAGHANVGHSHVGHSHGGGPRDEVHQDSCGTHFGDARAGDHDRDSRHGSHGPELAPAEYADPCVPEACLACGYYAKSQQVTAESFPAGAEVIPQPLRVGSTQRISCLTLHGYDTRGPPVPATSLVTL